MRTLAIWIVVVGVAILLIDMFYESSDDSALLVSGEDYVRSHSKDPGSVEFGKTWIGRSAKGSVACGYFNAKNSFGAYTGMQRFVANGGMMISDEVSRTMMDGMWQKFCAAPPN